MRHHHDLPGWYVTDDGHCLQPVKWDCNCDEPQPCAHVQALEEQLRLSGQLPPRE